MMQYHVLMESCCSAIFSEIIQVVLFINNIIVNTKKSRCDI